MAFQKNLIKMKIIFRADASQDIGTGHIMRCLALAQALRDRGAVCRFVCRELPIFFLERINRSGFEVFALPVTDPTELYALIANSQPLFHQHWLRTDYKTDATQTIAALENFRPNWLIVDHYAIDCRWELELRRYCDKIMVIDDLADRIHDCDVLLDQNLIANKDRRYESLVPENCLQILGPDYALLQPEYAEMHPRTPPRLDSVQRILIYFGGSDKHRITEQAVKAFLSLERSDIALDVVVNPGSSALAELNKQVAMYNNICLHEGLLSLAELMLKADIAIGAGGATSWERICLGLPTLVVTIAENQKPIVEELDRNGLVRWLGDQCEVSVSSLAAGLFDLISDQRWRQQCSSRCLSLLDGSGARRVTDLIFLGKTTNLIARPACVNDESLLFTWINESSVRRHINNLKPIDSTLQKSWFFKILRNPDFHQIIILQSEYGYPVGHVYFEFTNDAWEISYCLASVGRNLDLVVTLLHVAIRTFRQIRKDLLVFSVINNGVKEFKDIPKRAEINEGTLQSTLSARFLDNVAAWKIKEKQRLSITICSDVGSWINEFIPQLLLTLLCVGHRCSWVNDASHLVGGDICIYLSYGQIVAKDTLTKYRTNLVAHASDLPKGRGWSPASWMIKDDRKRIPVSLFEAVESVDAGPLYAQEWFNVGETDLIRDWQAKLAETTLSMLNSFIKNYPGSLQAARPQIGEPSYYPRRRQKDSVLDSNKTIQEQFGLLQIVDNDLYPAYFVLNGKEFVLKIFSRPSASNTVQEL